MSGLLFALATILAWGLWVYPAHGARLRDQRLVVAFATLANVLAAGLVAAWRGELFPAAAAHAWPSLAAGGLIWTLGALAAFAAIDRLGPARAMGIWAPLNILVSLAWGGLRFGEFNALPPSTLLALGFAVALLLAGLALLLRRESTTTPAVPDAAASAPARRGGVACALVAGLCWGSYFIPVQASGLSAWTAAWPLALGMAASAWLLLPLVGRGLPRPAPADAARFLASGLLWSVGNYASLFLMALIGVGRGFALAQLCLVVNALVGILYLRQPAPRSAGARRVLVGCSLATVGGVLLGLAR